MKESKPYDIDKGMPPVRYPDGRIAKMSPVKLRPIPRYDKPDFSDPIWPGDPRYEDAPYTAAYIIPD